ncbi:MAG: mechanosensitive ion channel domain-containing protein [Halodesulfurarchaeum sp.]
MVSQPLQLVGGVLEPVGAEILGTLARAVPSIILGLVFIVFAIVAIRIGTRLLQASLNRIYPADQHLIADFLTLIVTVFLWFAVVLIFLKIVGMGDIAASLGTAAGFVALGVSYALSNMIADSVAGVYLLKDPDFNPGDRVVADSVTGTVADIGLRKSRLRTDGGDTVVIANKDVEKRWTRVGEGAEE